VSRRTRGGRRHRRVARALLPGSTAIGFVAALALNLGGSSPVVVSATPPSSTVTTRPATGGTATGGTGATGIRSATGTLEQYGYGALSVRTTVNGTRITDVAVANLQTAEQYSQSLAQQVIPMLRNEVLSAQSANVATISGATYTSEAYLQSLQSALDAVHA